MCEGISFALFVGVQTGKTSHKSDLSMAVKVINCSIYVF